MRNKTKRLKEAIEHFEASDRNVDDYMYLFSSFYFVTKLGSGLIWDEIKEAIESCLSQKTK